MVFMCGIVFVVGNIDRDVKKSLQKCSRLLEHRGPDEHSVYTAEHVGLGHNRLAVISPGAGKQPVLFKDSACVFNGEIYNYKDLIREHRLEVIHDTQSDAAVIPQMYTKFSQQDTSSHDWINKLRGMYAFAIADERRFLVVRDPMGIKPLFMGNDSKQNLWFASEVKALSSICENITEIEPGSVCSGSVYSPSEVLIRKFYKPTWKHSNLTTNEVDFKKLRTALVQAVERRLIADVEQGCFLSGGLDSSLITSIVVRKLKAKGLPAKKLKTFSIGIEASDDLKAASKVAKFLGTDHHEVHFTVEQGISVIPDVIKAADSYGVDIVRAGVPMYLLSQFIKNNTDVIVLLSGEGADEIFGSYPYFTHAPSDEEFRKERLRRLEELHHFDVLRVDRLTMAYGLECRVPFLDRDFVNYAMQLPDNALRHSSNKLEKWILREAFNVSDEPYLPDDILWRKKQQFSDGVGFSWVDSLKEFTNSQISSDDIKLAEKTFPRNTPKSKEEYYYRRCFHEFNKAADASLVHKLNLSIWREIKDYSVRPLEA